VPELPGDPMQYASFLDQLRCFDNPRLTREDRTRTKMYAAERERAALKSEVGSLADWLEKLELVVEPEHLNAANLERAGQLLNKTNQMNLSTRRMTAAELLSWSTAEGNALWTFRVSDRFGQYGLCGLASVVREGRRARVLDFLLSCRVMGRGVEETMLARLAEHARTLGCDELYAEYVPTPKNQPCLQWFQNHAQFIQEDSRFRLRLAAPCGAVRQAESSLA
jgi:FkbH-like protein